MKTTYFDEEFVTVTDVVYSTGFYSIYKCDKGLIYHNREHEALYGAYSSYMEITPNKKVLVTKIHDVKSYFCANTGMRLKKEHKNLDLEFSIVCVGGYTRDMNWINEISNQSLANSFGIYVYGTSAFGNFTANQEHKYGFTFDRYHPEYIRERLGKITKTIEEKSEKGVTYIAIYFEKGIKGILTNKTYMEIFNKAFSEYKMSGPALFN